MKKKILQHDCKDCGPTCLRWVLDYYGGAVPMSKLRQYCATSQKGTSILGMLKAAQKLGFYAKAFKAKDTSVIKEITQFPIIVHIVNEDGYGHFIVIKKVQKDKVYFFDPAKGESAVLYSAFEKMWTKNMVVLYPNTEMLKEKSKQNEVFHFIKAEKKVFLKLSFFSICISILGIVSTYYYKMVMDRTWPEKELYNFTIISIGFLGIYILKLFFEYYRERLILFLGNLVQESFIAKYCTHLVHLPLNVLNTKENGEMLSRFYDITKIRNLLSEGLISLILDVLFVMVGSIAILLIDIKLFGIILLPLLLYGIVMLFFRKPLEKQNTKVMEADAKLNALLVETLNGIETIKSFRMEEKVLSKVQKRLQHLMSGIAKLGKTNNIHAALKKVVEIGFIFSVLWIGSYQVSLGELTQGELFTIYALITYYLEPVQRIVNLQDTLQSAFVAIERLYDIMDIEKEKDSTESNPPLDFKENITFQDVNFQYGYERCILEQLNLQIQYGSKVAIVGENGAGKSTLAKLLMRLYTCQSGFILLGNQDINTIPLDYVRNQIAYISQNVFFFAGTIFENFKMVKKELTEEEMVKTCKEFKLHEMIISLPQGYHTLLDENAANLSGGQKQCLAIARALLKQPQILIMDEATSNLDLATEQIINHLLHNIIASLTVIIIAHKFSTIVQCDKICVMKNGKIVEEGTHKELLQRDGYYSSLLETQRSL